MHMLLLETSDSRIPYHHLVLERELPASFDEPCLPKGYRFVNYKDGDKTSWIDIEISAKELKDREQGLTVWDRYYARWESILPERMFFIENAAGEKVATATAAFDTFKEDDGITGWLHWVGVRKEDQGKGLARPLIAHTLNHLIRLGYRKGHITTQTTTWVAARLYLDYGFLPEKGNLIEEKTGWQILKTLTDHPALSELESLPFEDLF